MRQLFAAALVALATLALASIAAAEPVWKSPGWYVVADTIVGPFVWSGPYADEASCQPNVPAKEDDADYACEYLAERPSWDD
jgi:hypothetical protein